MRTSYDNLAQVSQSGRAIIKPGQHRQFRGGRVHALPRQAGGREAAAAGAA
jgi:hypothetical protein